MWFHLTIRCCLKPLGEFYNVAPTLKNISPSVICLWYRGYLGDLLWIRVIIMTIIYHCSVTSQVPVNRGFRMIECRINHLTFSWSREWNWEHFHMWVLVTYKVPGDIYGFVAATKTFGRVLNLLWFLPLSLLLAISSCLFF